MNSWDENELIVKDLLERKDWYWESDSIAGAATWRIYSHYGRPIKRQTVRKETGLSDIEIELALSRLTQRVWSDNT